MRRPLSLRRGADPRKEIYPPTVLLVEDDAAVREVLRRALERAGCDVLEAANGREARRISNRHAETIQVLVTDVVMPLMSGAQLAQQLKRARPQIHVLYMSGYPDEVVRRYGVSADSREFMAKPLSCSELVAHVSDALATTARHDRAVEPVASFGAPLRPRDLIWGAADA